MSGDTDKLAQIEARQEDEPGAGYITLLPEERDALVEIAKAARECVTLEYDPARNDEINAELGRRADRLRDALSALDGDT